MTLTITIDCDNAAFTDNVGGEAARILRELADKICDYADLGGGDIRLMDINGNRVGECSVS
jgi:hypothetical protein